MRAVRLIAQRALSAFFTLPGGAALAFFLAASGARYVWLLRAGEGGYDPAAALWARAAVPFLPVLAAVLTMRLLAEERRNGTLDLLLSAAVREREIVLGKFAGAYAALLVALLAYLPAFVATRWFFGAPSAVASGGALFAFAALALQGMLWCAVGVALSAATVRAAYAFLGTVALCAAVPYALHVAAGAWLPAYRAAVPSFLPETHVYGLSTGFVSSKTVLFYFVWTAFALLVASKQVSALRFRHPGCLAIRLSTAVALLLAFACAALGTVCAHLADVSADFSSGAADAAASPRLRALLANANGRLRVTSYMPKGGAGYLATERLLNVVKNAVPVPDDVEVANVNPRWELAAASRLARAGVPENSIVLERGGHREVADAQGGEEALAAALQRLLVPQRARTVCFVTGHGEADPESYDPVTGYSDIARALVGNGYTVSKLDLASVPAVPADCAVMVMAGPRQPVPRAERALVDAWLRRGGRLLYLAHRKADALEPWGARVCAEGPVPARTSSGTDVVVAPSPGHVVTAPLAGGAVVLDSPLLVEPSGAAAASDSAADRIAFVPLLSVRSNEVVAAALQRGVTAKDLALRPTRAVVVGSDSFVMNGALGEKGAANGDFILNAVSWLAGVDTASDASASPRALRLGMAREDYLDFAVFCAAACPLAVFLAFALVGGRRLHRP